MAKDWESYKDEYTQSTIEHLKFKFRNLEREIKSPIERIMCITLHDEFQWAIDQNLSKLEKQKKIGPYTVDFYLSYNSQKEGLVEFIIECDGHDYHERTKQQAAHDKKRDRFFTERGYVVLRYTGSEIVKDYSNITQPIYGIIVKKDGVTGCG